MGRCLDSFLHHEGPVVIKICCKVGMEFGPIHGNVTQ